MTYNTSTYEITAFQEADLAADGHLNHGDTFTMGSATVCITVTDNDIFLSGDRKKNENANDHSYQTATITDLDGNELGNLGQIYAEQYWTVHGDNGRTYYLIEIEQEGDGQDFFTFYGDVPPAGTGLTVGCNYNVTSDWVDYKCLSAGLKWDLDDNCTYTIEAEDLALWNFNAVDGNNASGGELIKLSAYDGKASTDFGGESGTYNIKISAQDETDGASMIKVYVNGEEAGVIILDESQGNNGRGSDNGYFTEFSLEGIDISQGDTIELRAWADGHEFVRIDKIAFEQVKGGDIVGTVFCDIDCDGLSVATTTEPGRDYTIEAEDMYKWGFNTVHGAQASGGVFAKLSHIGGGGDLWTNFDGESGTYDLKIFAQDENDGQSKIFVKVNGHLVEVVRLDRDTDGGGSDNGNFSEFVVKDVKINQGDEILLWVAGDHGEFARIDKIELEGQDTVVTTPEEGKEGVLVTLTDADGNAILDDNGDAITTLTDADGNYRFEDIPAGDYRVRFEAPDGKVFTTQNAGDDDTIDSDVDDTGLSDLFTVTDGGEVDIDAGVKDAPEPELGSLSGRYFSDDNRDGLDNDGPANGIAGIVVMLLDENGQLVLDGNGKPISTTTGDNGGYSFGDLVPGTYGVKFTDPDLSRVLTIQDADGNGQDDIDSDAAPAGDGMSQILGIEVAAGADTPNNDAGVVDLPGSISGRYFCDENDNDVEDAGEAPIVGATVELVDANGAVVATATTNDSGDYTFSGVIPGDYTVRFEPVDGKDFVAQDDPNDNGDDTNDSDVDGAGEVPVSVAPGEVVTNVDAGVEDIPGSISGRYFCDENRNNVDDGEDGVGGVTVVLTDANGNFIADTVTESDGSYVFNDLLAGDYKVTFPEFVEDPEPPTTVDPDNVQSDDFSSGELEPFWTVTDPSGGGAEVDVLVVDGNAQLCIKVPAGDFDPNPGDGANDAVRVVQSVADADFQVETAFSSVPGERFEIQGIMVEQDADNWMRFDLRANGDGEFALFAGFADDGASTTELNVNIDDPADHAAMRVTRNGDDWTFETSADGIIWFEQVTFTHDGIEPNAVGPFGGVLSEGLGGGAEDTNGYEVKVDYFYNSQDRIEFDDSTIGLQSGKDFVAQDDGDDDTIDSDVNAMGMTEVISLAAGQDLDNVDAGVQGPPQGVIGDTIWFDSFGDGLLNDFEQRASGVTVQLKDADGTVIEETVTALDGTYLFQNLEAGDYSVGVVLADNFEFTAADTGDDTLDSDINPATGMTAVISLAEGEQNLDVDAGLLVCGLIEGTSAADPNSPVGGNDLLVGCATDDTILGFSGDDTLLGNDGNDELFGSDDNDILTGGGGDDLLDGGNDEDIAIYLGNQADYNLGINLVQTGSNTFTFDTSAAGLDEGTDSLIDIEVLRFADGDLIL